MLYFVTQSMYICYYHAHTYVYVLSNRRTAPARYLSIRGMRSLSRLRTPLYILKSWWFATLRIVRVARHAAESSMRRGTAVDVNEPIERTQTMPPPGCAPSCAVAYIRRAARRSPSSFLPPRPPSRRDVRSRSSLFLSLFLSPRQERFINAPRRERARGYARWKSQTYARKTRESTPCIFTHNSERREWLMKNIWIKRAVLTCPVIVGPAPMLNYYLEWEEGEEGRRK